MMDTFVICNQWDFTFPNINPSTTVIPEAPCLKPKSSKGLWFLLFKVCVLSENYNK